MSVTMKKTIQCAVIIFLFLFIGCSSTTPRKVAVDGKSDEELSSTNLNQIEKSKEIEELKDSEAGIVQVNLPIPKAIQKTESLKYERGNIQHFSLKYFKNHFDSWVNYLGRQDRERFLRQLENGKNFFPTISRILKEQGMPQELFLVGLIESGYYTKARSHASALGPWQFMKGTAIRYGLKVNRYTDERSDLEKSTVAAAHYYKDLYNIFGSWELALCAYNAGEYRIINAIRKGNTRDYLTLVRQKLIPLETVMYIPKLEAARELINNNQKYNLPFITDIFSKLKTSSELNIAENLESQTTESSVLNSLTTKKIILRKSKSSIKFGKKMALMTTKIKKGDKLSKIAEAYGIDMKKITEINHLKKEKILAGQNIKIPLIKKSYIVRRGDNLNDIAKAHGVSVTAILRHNQLDSKQIFPNQKLVVPMAYGAL